MMAETPSQAFNILKNNSIDFILLDLHLPEMNGIEFLIQLEEQSLMGNRKIIIVSAHKNVHFNHPNLITYIPKPISVVNFMEKMFQISQHNEINLCQRAS